MSSPGSIRGSLNNLHKSTSAKSSFEGKGTPEINLVSLTYSAKFDKIDAYLKKNPNLSITTMKDIRLYNLLHIACLSNQERAIRLFIEYAVTNHATNEEIKEWVNAKNDEGFAPIHFACFKGSLDMVQFLENQGADIYATNNQGLGVMHIAAQGDQPIVMAYFLKKGFDLHEKDDKGSTPLHWAAFLGMENSTAYLTSWGALPNIKDLESGFTPLHLAAVSGNVRVVRRLLIKGADRKIKDNEGKTASDLAEENEYANIVQILKGRSWIVECFNIKPGFQRRRSRLSLIFFIMLYLFVVLTNYIFIFPFIRQLFWVVLFMVFTNVTLFTFAASWLTNPGYMKNKKADILSLLKKHEAYKVCPECVILKPERSRHCDICGCCVAVFDHHCPWIDNCVGARNHKYFLLFVVSTLLSVLFMVIFAGFHVGIKEPTFQFFSIYFSDETVLFNIKETVCTGDFILFITFGIPLVLLNFVQLKNFITGKTTNERFGYKPDNKEKIKNEIPEESGGDSVTVTIEGEYQRLEDKKEEKEKVPGCWDNCFAMCCKNQSDPRYNYKRYSIN